MNTTTNPMEIAIIAVVIALIAIILAIFLYIKLKQLKNSIDNIVIDSYGINKHFDKKIKKYVSDDVKNRPQPQCQEGLSTVMYNDIVDNVIRQVEKRLSQNISVGQSAMQRDTYNSSSQVLYASSYNHSEGTFYEVSKQPTDITIFEITIAPESPNKGFFEVRKEVYERVLECKDFLEYCCEVEGDGSHIETIDKGEVAFNNDVWIVVKKLKVRFC